MRKTQLALIGFASAILLGCGGDGGHPSFGVIPTQPPPSEAPPEATAPAPITCQASSASLTKGTINVNGTTREYYESAPASILAMREKDARGIAVVVNFHDVNQTGESGAASTCWNEVGEAKGFVTVFSSALAGAWNTKGDASAADEAPS